MLHWFANLNASTDLSLWKWAERIWLCKIGPESGPC
jgi:hypothetical protein